MLAFIVRRLLLAVLTIWVISILSFAIIQLPPGDFVTAYIAQLSASGASVSAQEAAALRELYGLGQPFYVQYAKWISRVIVGDFGVSMEWNRPVTEVIGDRLWLTVLISFAALIVTWGLAFPIGIYSAVRQYSIGDYLFTLIGFIGLAVPNPPSVAASRMESLRALWAGAGLHMIETRGIVVERTFTDFEDFWATTLTMPNMGPPIAALASVDSERLKAAVRQRLSPDSAGRVAYSATANAIIGRVPG